jgi:hypothetical protein
MRGKQNPSREKTFGWLVDCIFCILACTILMCTMAGTGQGPQHSPPSVTAAIEASPLKYSPAMSSTARIGLTANLTGTDPDRVLLTWNVSYSTFLKWGSPYFTVIPVGNPVTVPGSQTLYWTYTGEGTTGDKAPVVITLTVEDAQGGVLLTSARLNIGWEDEYTAVIQGR